MLGKRQSTTNSLNAHGDEKRVKMETLVEEEVSLQQQIKRERTSNRTVAFPLYLASELFAWLDWSDAKSLSLAVPGLGRILKNLQCKLFVPESKNKKSLVKLDSAMRKAFKSKGQKQIQNLLRNHQEYRILNGFDWGTYAPFTKEMEDFVSTEDGNWGGFTPMEHQKKALAFLKSMTNAPPLTSVCTGPDQVIPWESHPLGEIVQVTSNSKSLTTLGEGKQPIRLEGCLLAGPVGTGKTLIACKYLFDRIKSTGRNSLIIAPGQVIEQWTKAMTAFMPQQPNLDDDAQEVLVIGSLKDLKKIMLKDTKNGRNCFIISKGFFQTLSSRKHAKDIVSLSLVPFCSIVIDEIQDWTGTFYFDYATFNRDEVIMVSSTAPFHDVRQLKNMFSLYNPYYPILRANKKQIDNHTLLLFLNELQRKYWKCTTEGIYKKSVVVSEIIPVEMTERDQIIKNAAIEHWKGHSRIFKTQCHGNRRPLVRQNNNVLARQSKKNPFLLPFSLISVRSVLSIGLSRESLLYTMEKMDPQQRRIYCTHSGYCGESGVLHFQPSDGSYLCDKHVNVYDGATILDKNSFYDFGSFQKLRIVAQTVVKYVDLHRKTNNKCGGVIIFSDSLEDIEELPTDLGLCYPPFADSGIKFLKLHGGYKKMIKVIDLFKNDCNAVLMMSPYDTPSGVDVSFVDYCIFTEPIAGNCRSKVISTLTQCIGRFNRLGQDESVVKRATMLYVKGTPEEEEDLKENEFFLSRRNNDDDM